MSKGKGGRHRVEIDPKKVEQLAAMGLTQHQICDYLGIAYCTLMNRRNELNRYGRELEEALTVGKSKGIAKVCSKLMEQVDNGNTTAMIFYLKTRAGWRETENINLQTDKGILVVEKTIKDD